MALFACFSDGYFIRGAVCFAKSLAIGRPGQKRQPQISRLPFKALLVFRDLQTEISQPQALWLTLATVEVSVGSQLHRVDYKLHSNLTEGSGKLHIE